MITLATAMAALLTLGVAPVASAATLYSNLGGGFSPSADEATQTRYLAQSFVATTSGEPRTGSFWAQSYLGQTASPFISIHINDTANGGQPGAAIAQASAPTIDADTESAPTCTTLTNLGLFGEPAVLTAGQTYWAVIRSSTNTVNWLFAGDGGGPSKVSTDSGASWAARGSGAFTIRIDDNPNCAPDINTNPVPGTELGDMYAKPTGTSFQTLFASNNGNRELSLTGGSFSGPSASMFKLFKGEPGGPEGSNFTFPKAIGSGTGGVILYTVCSPPAGTPDGELTATFTLTSNDPDEGVALLAGVVSRRLDASVARVPDEPGWT